MSDKFDGLDATEKAGIGATRTLNRCRAELGRRQETLAAAATRPVIAGKPNYRRLLESRTRKPRPKVREVRGANQDRGSPADHQRRKGAPSVAGGAKGSAGPPGKRNGQYRHGERTKAAIAEQRKFSALLKMLRAGLT